MVTFRQKGDFSKATRFLERVKEAVGLGLLDKYGQKGVAALSAATPVDSGETAVSWDYEIVNKKGLQGSRLQTHISSKVYRLQLFCNTDIALVMVAG